MRHLIIYVAVGAISIGLLNACGPSEEEIQRREQARQDSLEQVRQQQLEQQRRDSIEKARQDSIRREKERNHIEFVDKGPYAVQLEAWRSEVKAKNQANVWKERGYEGAYVLKGGNEETGNVWFRVRLGYLETKEMAEKLQDKLRRKHNKDSWISVIQ
jgi:cell division protein FtsN